MSLLAMDDHSVPAHMLYAVDDTDQCVLRLQYWALLNMQLQGRMYITRCCALFT